MGNFGKFRFGSSKNDNGSASLGIFGSGFSAPNPKEFTPEELMRIELEMQRKAPSRSNIEQLMKEIDNLDEKLKNREAKLQKTIVFIAGIIAMLLTVEVLLIVNWLNTKLN